MKQSEIIQGDMTLENPYQIYEHVGRAWINAMTGDNSPFKRGVGQ